MLRQKVSGSFVCVQCRLQLGAALPRRLFSATAPARRNEHIALRQSIIDAIASTDRKQPTKQAAKPITTTKPQTSPSPPDALSDPQGQQSIRNAAAAQEGANSGAQGTENAVNNDNTEQKGLTLFRLQSSGKGLSRRHEQTIFETKGVHPLLKADGAALERFYRRVPRDETDRPLSTKQIYKSRGKQLSAENEALSVDVMGQRSSAIIMRSHDVRKKKKKKTTKKASNVVAAEYHDVVELLSEGPKAEAKVEDQGLEANNTDMKSLKTDETESPSARIDDILENDDQYPTLSDAIRNIHELRPKSSHPLVAGEIEQLKMKLEEGFTAPQLQQYVFAFHSLPEKPTADEPQPEESLELPTIHPPWIVKKHPWVPVAPQESQETDTFEPYHPDMSPKERLVLQIVGDYWGLLSHTNLGVHGRLDVELADTEFGLLLVGTRRYLRDIARKSLGFGNQIEAVVPRKTISILAQKAAAESILMEINKILSCSKTIQVDTNLFSSKPVDPELLEEVGRLANSLVRLDSSGKKILVSWINLPEPRKGAENKGDVVLRLLLGALYPTPRTSSATSMLPASPSRIKKRGGGYVAKYDCEAQLPWHERHREWARWVAPADAILRKGREKIPQDVLPRPIEVKNWDATSSRTPGDPFKHRGEPLPQGGWSELTTRTTAVFGHILHARPANPDFKIRTEFKTSNHTFIPVMPPITALGLPTNLVEEGLWHYTVIIRFLPDPQRPTAPGSPTPPPLELRIEGDHKELKRIIEARAVTSSFTRDVLLPSAPVDVRLRQDRYFALPGITIDEHLPVMLKFLNDSDLAPWEDVMVMPPTLSAVRLPRSLLEADAPSQEAEKGASNAQAENAEEPQQTSASEVQTESADDFVTVDYRYAGFEIQRAVTAEHQGFKLTYSSSKGDKYASKTSQISLDAIAVNTRLLGGDGKPIPHGPGKATDSHPIDKPDAAEFMEVVSAMANLVVKRDFSKFGWEMRGIRMKTGEMDV